MNRLTITEFEQAIKLQMIEKSQLSLGRIEAIIDVNDENVNDCWENHITSTRTADILLEGEK